MPGETKIPNGFVFFPPDVPEPFRRRRMFVALVFLLAALSAVWPIYPLFSTVYPLIFSLPFSLGWLVIWLAITMAGLTWLYRTEPH